MIKFYPGNEHTANRMLINIYWVCTVLVFFISFSNTILINNHISNKDIFIGLSISTALGITLELWYFFIQNNNTFRKLFKYYIIASMISLIFYLLYICKDPTLLSIFAWPVIASALYFNNRVITYAILVDLLSISVLILNKLIDINLRTTGTLLYLNLLVFLTGCFFIVFYNSTKTIKVVREIEYKEENLRYSHEKLMSKQEETEALNKELISTNSCLEEAYNELTLKQQEVVALNHALKASNIKIEQAYIELNTKQQELAALNQELIASNDELVSAYDELNLKQQEVIALNHAFKTSNEKLEKANKELNANQQEMAALNEELIATNDSLEEAYNELKNVQLQLIQNEKMASLGQLSAGVAHEINTPMGAINCNVDLSKKLILLLRESLSGSQNQKAVEALSKLEELNHINIMASERIVRIVKSLKSFARLDSDEYQETDIHRDIDNTLILANNKLKNRIEVIKDYGDLPLVKCYPNQLNQVFMNLIVNAADAVPDNGKIWIKTFRVSNNVFIKIRDNGTGIRQEHLEKIFNPGFTTKGVGVGTGLGLAIAYNIIEKHEGKIQVESEVGKGTEFTIELPLKKAAT